MDREACGLQPMGSQIRTRLKQLRMHMVVPGHSIFWTILHQGDMDNHQNKGDDVGWTKNRYLLVQSLADRHPFLLCVYTDTFCSLHIISKYSYLMRPCLLLNKLCTLPVPNEKQVTFLWYSRAGVIWSLFHRLLGDLYSSSKMITKSDLKQIWV